MKKPAKNRPPENPRKRPLTAKEVSTINDRWKSYEAAVLDPAGAGPVQRVEMKRAFFMGAASLFDIMTEEIAFLPDIDAEEMAAMNSIGQQILGFNEAVKLGAA